MCRRVLAVFLFLAILISIKVFGEDLPCDVANNCCGNLPRCEKPKLYLIRHPELGGLRWDSFDRFESVDFMVNSRTYPGLPNLVRAAQTAASKWSRIQFRGRTVNIALNYTGTQKASGTVSRLPPG